MAKVKPKKDKIIEEARDLAQDITEVYYGTYTRGLMLSVSPELPLVTFGSTAFMGEHGDMYIKKLNLKNEVDKMTHEAIKESIAFKKERVVYLPNPAELKKNEKREEQAANLERYREDYESGILKLDLDNAEHEALIALGDKIGVKLIDINGRPLSSLALKASIASALGMPAKPIGGKRGGNKKRAESKD